MTYPIVERAKQAPFRCAVSADIDGPFVDCGLWAPPVPSGSTPYLYLHTSVAEKIGESVGMVRRSELDELRAAFDEQGKELEALREIATAITTLQDAEEKVKALA